MTIDRGRAVHGRGQHRAVRRRRRAAASTPTSAASCARSRTPVSTEWRRRRHRRRGSDGASALVAMAELGARDVRVLVRRPERRASRSPSSVGGSGSSSTRRRSPRSPSIDDADLVISTLPGTRRPRRRAEPRPSSRRAPLLDVAYDPWPTALGASWLEGGGRDRARPRHAAAPGAAAGAHLRERRPARRRSTTTTTCSPSCATPCV